MREGQASTLNLDVVNINTIQIECIARAALKAGPLGPGWIDPHIGIMVKKKPQTHLNGHIRPKNLYIWTQGPWYSLWRLLYL